MSFCLKPLQNKPLQETIIKVWSLDVCQIYNTINFIKLSKTWLKLGNLRLPL